VGQFDFDVIEKRFLFEHGGEFGSIDQQFAIYDFSVCAEADIFDVNTTEIQSHGPIIII